jgi:hypothetical protein
LFNLLRNYSQQEYRLFYKEHNIDGYEQERNIWGVDVGYRSNMSQMFSLSLTSDQNESDQLWEDFAHNGTGVKLTFKVEPNSPDFRKVYYSNRNVPTQIPLLLDLFSEIQTVTGYPLNFTSISKIGAFYIRGIYSNEDEYRFLIKRDSASFGAWDIEPVQWRDDITYIVLPFESRFGKFSLTKVQRGPNCRIEKFNELQGIIETANYGDVDIID